MHARHDARLVNVVQLIRRPSESIDRHRHYEIPDAKVSSYLEKKHDLIDNRVRTRPLAAEGRLTLNA